MSKKRGIPVGTGAPYNDEENNAELEESEIEADFDETMEEVEMLLRLAQ